MKHKEFDCVKMKSEIQERLQARLAGLSPTEAERAALEQILADPAMAKLWKEARRRGPSAPPPPTASAPSS